MSVELSETDELHAISSATNDDGTIDVELHDFNKTEDGFVGVEFLTPTGEIEREVMPWPEKDSDEYKFVRIFNKTGYGIIAAEDACESGVTVPATNDPWQIHAPTDKRLRERVDERLSNSFDRLKRLGNPHMNQQSNNVNLTVIGSTAIAPLIVPLSVLAAFDTKNNNPEITGYGAAVIHILLWGMFLMGLPLLL